MQHGYPHARERAGPGPATLTDRFREAQTTAGFVAVTDADAEVIVFSGRPDRVLLTVEVNDVIVSLRDRARDAADEVTLRAGQAFTFQQTGERVVARNATAGLAGRVQVIGSWV
jgi:hypothetical protein